MYIINVIIRSCPRWGAATERWRRNGAYSETKVLEDVITASRRGKQEISTVNN